MTVRTRFAPSPTGVLHIGSVRTALFCWLYARHCGGEFLLRIEDTDRERSTAENVEAIFDGLDWLGIEADVEPVFQTQRFPRYREVIEGWLAKGLAYHCYCTREELAALREKQMSAGEKTRYDGRCRERSEPREGVDPVVRFRNPDSGEVVVDDLIRGRVVFSNTELDDLIIARSDGTPTYNFTVVVDDNDMSITHVMRGDDHLNNTPRQINMLQAMGASLPNYAHLPMILGPDGAKLSKRHGAVDVREFRSEGYLPEALLNYLVRLGWSHGDQEVFSLDEMIELFEISDVNQSASTFNPEKLLWLNQQHIIGASAERLGRDLQPFLVEMQLDPNDGPDPARVADGFRERATTLRQMAESCRYCYADFDEIDPAAAKKHLRPAILEPLRALQARLVEIDDWNAGNIDRAIKATAAEYEMSLGKLGQPVRVAVTGGPVSPPIDITVELVGRRRTLARLSSALDFVASRADAAAS